VTKVQANVLIGVVVVAILAAFLLYIQSEERTARATGNPGRCWTNDCVVDIGMDAADRLMGR
jgi:hypothetical protein